MTYKTNEIQRKEVRGVRINLSAEARVTNTSVKTIKKDLVENGKKKVFNQEFRNLMSIKI